MGALLGQALDRRLQLQSWAQLRERLGGRPALLELQQAIPVEISGSTPVATSNWLASAYRREVWLSKYFSKSCNMISLTLRSTP